MTITIKYRAKLTYQWAGKFHEDELCDIVHEIDNEKLQTTNFDFHPVKEEEKSKCS